jgi:hypothetical protein
MLNEWFATVKPEELRVALQSPIIQEALTLLKNVGQPRNVQLPQSGVTYIEHNALLNARREGYYDALRNLEVLSMTKNRPEAVEESEPWTPSTVQETTT